MDLFFSYEICLYDLSGLGKGCESNQLHECKEHKNEKPRVPAKPNKVTATAGVQLANFSSSNGAKLNAFLYKSRCLELSHLTQL